jgi:hypothetical protein
VPPETRLHRSAGEIAFVVRTDDPAYQDVLADLRYTRSGDEFTRSFSTDAPDVARIFDNFQSRIEEVLAQAARRRPVPWESALRRLATRLDAAGADWALVGSAALAVRGIPVSPRDLDIVAAEHEPVAAALSNVLIEPPVADAERGWIAAWFGRAFLDVRIEWVADVYPEFEEWHDLVRNGLHDRRCESVAWDGLSLRVPLLERQLATAESRGHADHAAAIRSFLSARTSPAP